MLYFLIVNVFRLEIRITFWTELGFSTLGAFSVFFFYKNWSFTSVSLQKMLTLLIDIYCLGEALILIRETSRVNST